MKNIKFIDDVKNVLDKFGPEILTGLGIIFTGLAIKSAIDAAEEATEVDMEYRVDVKELEESFEKCIEQGRPEVKKALKTRKLQKHIEKALVYKWSFIFGFASATCMICSTKISGAKLGAALALAKLNEDKLKIALEKTKEMFGEDGEKTLKDKIVEELAIKNDIPLTSTKNPDLNEPEIFVDSYTGAWIETTRENINHAAEEAKRQLSKNHTLPYRKWYMILGLPGDATNITNIGWNVFNPFEIEIVDKQIGNKMMHNIVYKNEPKQNFYHMTR